MSATSIRYNNHAPGNVAAGFPALLRRLNTETLALALFVALAILTPPESKRPDECGDSAPAARELTVTSSPPKILGNKLAPNR
jgi:hypothetical protein